MTDEKEKVEGAEETDGIFVTVIYGANEETINGFTGKTVGEIRQAKRESMNIPQGATAYLNGEAVDDDAVVEDGDSLEFSKLSGRKG